MRPNVVLYLSARNGPYQTVCILFPPKGWVGCYGRKDFSSFLIYVIDSIPKFAFLLLFRNRFSTKFRG